MKKFAPLLISLILLAGTALAGCSSKSATSTSDSSPSAQTSTQPEQTVAPTPVATEDPSKAAFTIRLSAFFIDDRSVMQDLKKNIESKYKEKYPNATIQWDVLLGEKYAEKLKAELASNTAADVIFHSGTLPQFVDAGYFTDLSDQPWASKLVPGTSGSTTVNGKVYGGTLGLNGSGVWYNKKLFSDLGLTPPKTWSDFTTLLEKIKVAGKVPIAVGFKDSWTASLFFMQLSSSYLYGIDPTFGMQIYDGQKKIDGPEMQAVMGKIQELTQKGYFNKTALTIDWPQSADIFSSGGAGMIVQGPWLPGSVNDDFTKKSYPAFDIGYFQIPDDNGFYDIAVSSGESLSVNIKSKLQQQAKDLVFTIMSEDILSPYDIGSGLFPPLQDMKVTYPSTAMNEFLDYVSKGKTINNVIDYIGGGALTSLTEEVTKIVSGSKFNPSDLKDAQDKFEKEKPQIVLPHK